MRVPLADAAAATGVPVRTLRRWCAQGRITVARRGRHGSWLVHVLEVQELEELRERRGKLTR